MSSFIDCFELLRLACGRWSFAGKGGCSVIGVDLPSREVGSRTLESEVADSGSVSSCALSSSSSLIVGKCSESSPECSELLSPCNRLGRVPARSDFDDDPWSGYSHSRLPFRQPVWKSALVPSEVAKSKQRLTFAHWACFITLKEVSASFRWGH